MKGLKVTTIGPNGLDDASFHVHLQGCQDTKGRKYRRSEKYNEEITSKKNMVEGTYSDQIAENENGTWEDYLDEFRFFPCLGEVPLTAEEVEEEEAEEEEEGHPNFEDLEAPEGFESTVNSNYPLGKNQKVVLDFLGDHTEYFRNCNWVWYFHSSTVEVLNSLELRGLAERYIHEGTETWAITEAGKSVYNSLTDQEREVV